MITKENMIGCKPQFFGFTPDNKIYAVLHDFEDDDYFVWFVSTPTGYGPTSQPITEYHTHTFIEPVDGVIYDTGNHRGAYIGYPGNRYFPQLKQIEKAEGIELHAKNGCLHREDGPAVYSKDVCLYFLWGDYMEPLQYWEKQKDTEHAPKIFALVFGDKSEK